MNKIGLKVNGAKTKIVAATDGFDFLGWHFRVKGNGKLKITPSKGNFSSFRKKIEAIIKESLGNRVFIAARESE